jgi:VanZ family protein
MSSDRRLLALRCAAWFCVALIAYLSLIPHRMEVRTLLPPGIEHAIAYAGTAGLMACAYPRRSIWLIVGALCVYSGALEILQTFSSGRHPGLDGVLWSSAGSIIGGLSIALASPRLLPVVTKILRGPPK